MEINRFLSGLELWLFKFSKILGRKLVEQSLKRSCLRIKNYFLEIFRVAVQLKVIFRIGVAVDRKQDGT